MKDKVDELRGRLESDANRILFDMFGMYMNGVVCSEDSERVLAVQRLASAMSELSRNEVHDVLFASLSRLLDLEMELATIGLTHGE